MQQDRLLRGNRLKTLRSMLDKSQQEFAILCGVSTISIGLWENGNYNGLSKKGAQKVINALEKHGIACSLSWLWLGLGNPPNYSKNIVSTAPITSVSEFDLLQQQLLAIKEETALFLKNIPNSVVLEVMDDAMVQFNYGDFIGAIWSDTLPECTHDHDVLVLLEDGRMLIRKIGYDENKSCFFLCASNLKSSAADLFIGDAKIQKYAEIVRLWRIKKS